MKSTVLHLENLESRLLLAVAPGIDHGSWAGSGEVDGATGSVATETGTRDYTAGLNGREGFAKDSGGTQGRFAEPGGDALGRRMTGLPTDLVDRVMRNFGGEDHSRTGRQGPTNPDPGRARGGGPSPDAPDTADSLWPDCSQPWEQITYRQRFEATASTIGIDAEILIDRVANGESIADIARAEGMDPQSVIDASVAAAHERLEAEVAAGRLSQEMADRLLADVEERVAEFVNDPPIECPTGTTGGDDADGSPEGEGRHRPDGSDRPGRPQFRMRQPSKPFGPNRDAADVDHDRGGERPQRGRGFASRSI